MATINHPKLFATKIPGTNNWDMTVKYTAQFSQFEVTTGNFTFRDGFVLWEDDSGSVFGGGDDQLTGVVAVSTFNPSARTMNRTLTFRIDGDKLDTELGQEELYAIVRLRNIDLNVLVTRRTTPNLALSP